jgi:hypothetical protein
MDSPYEKSYTFTEIKAALLDKDRPFPAQMLYFFSDITRDDLRSLEKVWPKVWTERRRGLLEDMENLAEADTILFFDHVAAMCLEDEDPLARATAIRLLWQSEDEKLVPKLLKRLEEDPESIVRAAAATALGIFVYQGELEEISEATNQTIIDSLIKVHLGNDDRLVRRRALESLGYTSHPDVPGFIQQAYDTEDEEWLQSALCAMGRSYDQRWAKAVFRMFNHPDNLVRYEAVRAAGELEMSAARELLFDLIEEGTDDEDLYFAAIWALSKIGGKGVRKLIESSIDEAEDDSEVQFLEEALENLDFTEQTNMFDMLVVDEDNLEDDDDDWLIDDFDGDDYNDDDDDDYDGYED